MIKETVVSIALVVAMITVTPTASDTYQPPQVRPLADPFGRNAPPDDGRVAPPLRPDPIPAYRDFPHRWKLMQRQTCQPVFDPQTGRSTAWRCRMADGTIQEIR